MPQSRPPMENYKYYWERPPAAVVPPRHRKNNPSFSSSLLDAITRSIDDSDSSGAAGGELHRNRNPSGGAPDPTTRRDYSSSSSSSSSSFFSSSDADTPIRIRPIRTGPVLARSDRIRSDPPLEKPNQTQKEQKQLTSIKKKLRELRRSAGPASPGARLAGFLNSLFHPAGAGKTKKKPSASASSGSSSCSRSCLSKTPSTRVSGGGKRSVRFSPVGVILGEDCRPCGEKVLFAGDFPAPAPAPARKSAAVEEMMMRAVAMEEDYESDSSEDLFELENLGGILAADGSKNSGNASFRNELPVYETTSLGINRAIARGLTV